MNIYILRHGIAVEPGTPGINGDPARPLTPEGEDKLKRIAAAMQAMKLTFDVILSSPYLRAKLTADLVATNLGEKKKLSLTDHLTPEGDPKKLVEQLNGLKPLPENVLLVGHEPYLSRLIGLLTSGNTGLAIDMKKGGLCKLDAEPLKYGRCAVLNWLLTPKQMALMAKDEK